jgi:hypothetical protein
MENDLEYKIEVRKEEEHKTLYEWYIAEIDDEGEEVGFLTNKSIPFLWTNFFRFKNLNYASSLEFDRRDDLLNKSKLKDLPEVTESQVITGNFFPYEIDDNQPKYSMFGTDRYIEEFKIFIQKSDEPYCQLHGTPGFEYENDFRNHYVPDSVEITLGVSEKKFNEISEAIRNKSISSLFIQLSAVKGFYSNWSPSISTMRMKVLTRAHNLEIPKDIEKDIDIELHHLGEVGEFKLNMEIANDFVVPPKIFDDNYDEYEKEGKTILSPNEELQKQTRNEIIKLGEIIKAQRVFMFGIIFLLLILVLIFLG